MKGKFITLVLTLGFLAAFGVFMHSPPSILDGLTGATPKAKRAAQMAAPLEGNYLFCINPALEPFSDADFRNDLKAFVSGERSPFRCRTAAHDAFGLRNRLSLALLCNGSL